MLTDFLNSFADRLGDKFATKKYSNTPYICRYTTLWNMNVRKLAAVWNIGCIAINDKSQGSRPIAKHLSWDVLLNYKFTIQLTGEIIFKIGENLAKLQAKWLIVCHALHFCPQKCRTGQISKLTCSLGTETATNCCFVNRQINVSLLSTNIKLL